MLWQLYPDGLAWFERLHAFGRTLLIRSFEFNCKSIARYTFKVLAVLRLRGGSTAADVAGAFSFA